MIVSGERTKKEILSWVKTIIFAVLFALLVNHVIVVNAAVPTGSMEDTIMVGDRVIAFRGSYLFDEPKRYDIVVFRPPDEEEVLYVKRIIGLPGDKIDVRDGRVYINDSAEPIADKYIREAQHIEEEQVFNVPEGHYFMMGDNRNHSNDSRRWHQPYVAKNKILGKVVFRYFPIPKTY
ncbi:signal peptidase I [Clostridia bacterium]|nr:signal peptidase I [Clostridia bacterium]